MVGPSDTEGQTYVVLQEATTFTRGKGPAVSVVVPCYNEEEALPHLTGTLARVVERHPHYRWRFLFVDDRSTDRTAQVLHEQFGAWPHVAILQHVSNQGMTGAILTGIRHAKTELVCSIDCDQTYDPNDLGGMLALLKGDVDMVTASPYHPRGGVEGVPPWRLFVSRGASLLYRLAFWQPIYTYTCCVRVYRRSAVLGLDVTEAGFSGVTEMLLLLVLEGGRVAEFPAVLRARQFGQSKMKVVRNTVKHLSLLGRLAVRKYFGTGARRPAPVANEAPRLRDSA